MKKHLLMLFVVIVAAAMSLKAQTIVIDDGFENGIQDSVWTQEFVIGEHPWAVEGVEDNLAYPNKVYQGSHRAYLRNTSGETEGYVTRLVSRVMDLSPEKVYQPELTFWYANPKWTADRDTLRVLYRTNENAKWKQLAEFSTASANWQKVSMSLPEVNETYQIAFEGTDNLGRGIVLDSIKLRSAPECTVPHDITANSLGNGKVLLAWNASWDANAYELIVVTEAIDPDTVANVADSILAFHGEVPGLQQNYELKLTSGEYYYVYLRSLCTAENSAWNSEDPEQKGAFYFRVKATKYLPYSYDFHMDYQANTIRRDPEWTWGGNTGKFNPFISTHLSSADAVKYSIDAKSVLVFSGDNNTTTALKAGNYAYVATPGLADSTVADFKLNTCQVSFWSTVHTYTGRTYAHSIIVGVMTDPEDITTFVPVDTVSVYSAKAFQENIVDLSSYQGDGEYVAFVSAFDVQNLFYLEKMVIEQKKAEEKVTRISANPRDTYATLSWNGKATSYRLIITNEEVNDPAKASADKVVLDTTVTANACDVEGLEAGHSWNAPYYAYVKAGNEGWSYRYPFVTITGVQPLPLKFDMEQTSSYYIGTDASKLYPKMINIFSNDATTNNTSAINYPYLYTTGPMKGLSSLYLSKPAGKDVWVTLPLVENLKGKQMTFYLSGSTTPTQAHATVGVMSNPMDINTFNPIADFDYAGTYIRCYVNFANYTGEDGVIAIVWTDVEGMSKNTINYIDELTIEEIAACLPPSKFDIQAESDTVVISWPASSVNQWEIILTERSISAVEQEKSLAELAEGEFVKVADTITWDQEGNPTFGFGKLDFYTPYYIYVRALCGEELSWFTEATFVTACPSKVAVPYTEGFEKLTGTDMGCWQGFDMPGTGYPKIMTTSHNGSNSLELWSTSTTHRSWIAAPLIDADFEDLMVEFYSRSYGTSTKSVIYTGFMSDPSDSSTFVAIDTFYMANGARFYQHNIEMAPYKAYQGQYIVFTTGLDSVLEMNSDIYIDDISFKSTRCAAPYGIDAENVEMNSFDIVWEGKTDDKWEVKVLGRPAMINPKTKEIMPYDTAKAIINDTIVSSRMLHVEGLTKLTKYYVYIRPTCGDSIWASATLKTACARLNPNAANKENFDGIKAGTTYNENFQVDCWTGANANPSASTSYLPYVYEGTTYASSGKNSYKLYGYYSASATTQSCPAWLASPEIQCENMNNLLVTFSYYMATTSTYALILGVMTDPEDISTFVKLDSIIPGSSAVIRTYSIDLKDYADSIPAEARYFAWRTPVNATTTVYLDDISIISMACPLVKPSYSDLTSESVRISSGLRTDNDWILKVANKKLVADSLNNGFVYPDSIFIFADTLDTRSKIVKGLEEQKTYYVAMASLCEGETPYWTVMSFTTPCEALTPEKTGTITFSTDDGYITGSSGAMPCWTKGNKMSTSTTYIPYVNTTASYKHNDNNYLYMYTTTSYNGAYAIMPQLKVDSIKDYQVNFYARANTSTSYNNQVIVGIISDPSDLNTFVVIDTLTLSRTAYEPFTISFEKYEGDYLGNYGKNIMFLSEFAATNYAYISEISVEPIPSCRPVTAITVDSIAGVSAYISFESEAPKARLLLADKELANDSIKAIYKYLVDTVVTSYDSVLIEDLEPATIYYAYVQNICSDSDSSKVSLAFAQFFTECPADGFKAPYYTDFDKNTSSGTGVRPDCWEGVQLTFDTVGTTQSYPYVYASNPYSGKNDLYMYSYLYYNSSSKKVTTNNKSYAVAPTVKGNLNDYLVSFYARQSSTGANYGTKLLIGYVTNTDQKQIDSTFVQLGVVEVSGTVYQYYEFSLLDKPAIPAGARIALKADASAQGMSETQTRYSYFYVDNFRIGLPPTCYPPTLAAGKTTLTTAEVKITPAVQGGELWELAVLTDSAYQKIEDIKAYLDTVTNTVMADSMNYVVPGLKEGTKYQVYARTVCGGEDGSSTWTESPIMVITKYYYKDAYFFGFEKKEDWIRSLKSTSDANYIHPALTVDYYTQGTDLTSAYCPFAQENTTLGYGYGKGDNTSGKAALKFYAYKTTSSNYYGGYVVFPAIGEPKARSFEFKARNAYVTLSTTKVSTSYPGHIQLGTIDKDGDFSSFQLIADLQRDKLETTQKAEEENDYLFETYTFNFDSITMATKQLVIYQPEVDMTKGASYAMTYVDNVILGATKDFATVSITSIAPADTTALVSWSSMGGPWNLKVTHTYHDEEQNKDVTVTDATYSNLTATSQKVDGLTPNSIYTVTLTPANAPASTPYALASTKSFKTSCTPLEADADGAFVWDFNDPNDWERTDKITGTTNTDSAYYKPGCFTTGWNYSTYTPTSTTMPYQWLIQRKGMSYTSAPTKGTTYTNYEYGRDDSPALRVYTSSSYNTKPYIVLPPMNCDMDTMMIEFYGRCFASYDKNHSTKANQVISNSYLGASYCKSVVVGTLTDPNDFSTLEVLDTLTYSQTTTTITSSTLVTNDPDGLRYWERMIAPLSGANGKYIVIYQPAYGLFFLDDLSVKPVGDNIFAPSKPATDSVSQTTASFSWSVRHPSLPSVIVVLDEKGEEEVLRDTIVGTNYTAEGLNPATIYQWYMYQTNAAGTIQSKKTEQLTFTTDCLPIDPSYTTSFEVDEGYWILPAQTTATYKQNKCWVYENAGTSAVGTNEYNQTGSATAGYGHNGAYGLKMYAYSTTLQTYAAMPAMDVNAFDTLQVNFWMRPGYHNPSTGKITTQYTYYASASTVEAAECYYAKSIIVGTMTDPHDASTFVAIDTINYNGTLATTDEANAANNYLFQKKKVSLRGATGPYVTFMTTLWAKGATNKSTYDYVWLDDISFSLIQECAEPVNLTTTDITASSAKISWEGSALTKKYVLQVSADPTFTEDTAFVYNDTIEATSYDIEKLEAFTNYAWRVQAICGEEYGESEFTQNEVFRTLRIPYFLEDFRETTLDSEWEFGTTPAVQVLDSAEAEIKGANNSTYGFKRTTYNYGIYGSHYCAPFFSSSTVSTTTYDHYWMISPAMYLPDTLSAHLTLDLALTQCTSGYTPTENPITADDVDNLDVFAIIISDDAGKTYKTENAIVWNDSIPGANKLSAVPATAQNWRIDLSKYAGKNIRIAFYRESETYKSKGSAMHIGNIRVAYYNDMKVDTTACQYEDVEAYGFYIDGDQAEAGEHTFKRWTRAKESEALAGVRDTMYTLTASIYEAPETIFADTICEGDSYTSIDFSGKTRAGVYRHKMQSVEHCDSIITLNLKVTPRSYAEDELQTLCPGESYVWNEKTYDRAGLYRDTTVSVAGCDSVMTLVLSYYDAEDTIYDASRIEESELPFTYQNEQYPYIATQAPIFYAVGTEPGLYVDTVLVQGTNCTAVLVHTLEIYREEQGIDDIDLGKDARKLIYHDHLYIICKDEWYNAEGKKVSDPRK